MALEAVWLQHQDVRSRTLAARQHVEEVNHILVFWEDTVVVEVDVIARCACRAREHVEEINNILIFREDFVVIEVDVIARRSTRVGAAGGQRTLPRAARAAAQCVGQAQTCTRAEAARAVRLRAVRSRARRTHAAERTSLAGAPNRRGDRARSGGQAASSAGA